MLQEKIKQKGSSSKLQNSGRHNGNSGQIG